MVTDNEENSLQLALTPSQRRRLENALATHQKNNPVTEQKPALLNDEERRKRYLRKVRESMAEENILAQEARAETIRKNLHAWSEKIESRWQDASLETATPDVQEAIKERLRRWEMRKGMDQTSLLFAGEYGKGKTWSAYAYPYELIKQGHLTAAQIYCGTEATLAQIATSGFQKGENFNKIINSRHKLFLIDDVGRGVFGNEHQRGEIWFELINFAYSRRLSLVLTTNLSVAKDPKSDAPASRLEMWIGRASMERLRSMVLPSGYVPFLKNMPDMRTEKAREWHEEFYNSNTNPS